MAASRFEIVIGPHNKFQWKYFAPDGTEILASDGFGNKNDAFAAIRAVKDNACHNERYEKRAEDGKCCFRLKSASHQILATSGLFENEEGREKAIAVVRGSQEAAIMDKTA